MDLKSITRTLALLGTGLTLAACAASKDAQELSPPESGSAPATEGEKSCGAGSCGGKASDDPAEADGGGEAEGSCGGDKGEGGCGASAASAEAPTAEPEPEAVAETEAAPAARPSTSTSGTKKKPAAKKSAKKAEAACGEGTCA